MTPFWPASITRFFSFYLLLCDMFSYLNPPSDHFSPHTIERFIVKSASTASHPSSSKLQRVSFARPQSYTFPPNSPPPKPKIYTHPNFQTYKPTHHPISLVLCPSLCTNPNIQEVTVHNSTRCCTPPDPACGAGIYIDRRRSMRIGGF